MSARCPTKEVLSRGLSLGADEPLRAHLAACPACQREWDSLRRVDELSSALPRAALDPEQVAAVCSSLVAAAAAQRTQRQRPVPRRRAAWLLAAAVLLFVGVGLRIIWPDSSRSPQGIAWHGAVKPLGAARYVQGGPPEDEVVRLVEGTVVLEVRRLGQGQRFRVLTNDAEVEVRGTLFEVSAAADRLTGVRVMHGAVEVRPPSGAAVLLGSGERWAPPEVHGQAPAPAPSPAPAVPARPASPAPPAGKAQRQRPALAPIPAAPPVVTPPAPTATPAEQAFAQGWDALRAGQYGPAAAAFGAAAKAAGDSPLAEDARYWGAVSWQRSGRSAEALQALREFLARHGGSPRAGEAAALLGWLLFDSGQVDEAERRFQAAAKDANQQVRRSAQEGLSAIGALRARKQPAKPAP